MTELRHLQLVILSIAKDIDALCSRNGIEYSLNGGSAIGAVRHQGFIPWDDDLDIQMTPPNYRKFISICREQLDKEKYYFEEGLVDWPLDFCKVKLRGTRMEETEGYAGKNNQLGIFVDIFRVDGAAPTKAGRMWQYFCARYRMAFLMRRRGYKSASRLKKLVMALSVPQYIPCIERFFKHEKEKYDGEKTGYYAFLSERITYRQAFCRKEVFAGTKRMPFEDTELPVPSLCDEYLRGVFGDYMQLPPADQQVPAHHTGIDFGKY
ncbi:LicD family protein [Prevotella dentasini]|uniref:LicD family protein n=1 Tax=Prevotella dentasini TaxID=589537 RepID=UPI000468A50D|nr:LicD family protein [Prevotella dentasini]